MATELDDRARILVELPAGDSLTVRDVLAHQERRLIGTGITTEDARDALAREHYFRTWDAAVAAGDRTVDRRFEAAADAIVAGDAGMLAHLLAEDPQLATARSPWGHRQTLLHHLAANGIESARQWQTPHNAVELTHILLAAGADPNATCESYSPRDTVLTLLCSSAHPAEAGLQTTLIELLVASGALVNGPQDDCAPLWTAAIWGYQHAVDALIRCGARIDNLVLAAASGDTSRVREYLAPQRAGLPIGGHDKYIATAQLVEHALIYAAGLGRHDVVVQLLALAPDLSVREPFYDATALDVARYKHPAAGRPDGNPTIVGLLEPLVTN